MKLHLVEFLQQVVGELDIGLVNLVDQQHDLFVRGKRLPELAALDIVFHVMHALFAKLAVAQPADGVVFVKTLLRLGGRFDIPFDQAHAKRLRHLTRKFGLAGAGLALDQKRALKRHGGIDRHGQVIGGDIGVGAFKFHLVFVLFAAFGASHSGHPRLSDNSHQWRVIA